MVKGGDGATIALGICHGDVITALCRFRAREMEQDKGRTIRCYSMFEGSRAGDMR